MAQESCRRRSLRPTWARIASAVKAGATAMPDPFVVTVANAPNVPPAPVAGRAKVTAASGTGVPLALVTVACKRVPNAVLIGTLWPDPWLAAMMMGGAPAKSGAEESEMVPSPLVMVIIATPGAAADGTWKANWGGDAMTYTRGAGQSTFAPSVTSTEAPESKGTEPVATAIVPGVRVGA